MALRQSQRRRADDVARALAEAEAAERAGAPQRALQILLQAVRAAPDAPALYPALARRLAPMRFSDASPAVAAVVARALDAPWIDPQPLAPAAISLANAARLDDAAFAGDPLVLTLLQRVLLPDAALEARLTRLRRARLLAALDGETPEADAPFATALARQTLLNGWMWTETAAETAGVDQLRGRLLDQERFGFGDVVYGMYRPLTGLAGVSGRAAKAGRPWRLAAATLVMEPLEERRLADATPRLEMGAAAATQAVKAQYEAHPYPRWTGAVRRRPRPIRDVAQALFPHAALPAWPTGPIDVLIAGCGAGKHAADVVSRFQGARILAIDLSRTALGYAARMLKGTPDLSFAEADILALGAFERRFDHIESVGVLHHLADPLAGLQVLAGLLKPEGSLRVGFYSRRGRWRVKAAREALADVGFHGRTDADLRAARAYALGAPEGSDAWRATQELDFYAASGARDFLFHAHEAEYLPAELAEMADAAGLQVAGLELTDPAAAAAYRMRFPDDPAMADLRRWDALEAEHPDIFRHMCQFWLRHA